MKKFFDFEEPDAIYYLCEVHAVRVLKFDVFSNNAKEFLEEDVGTTMDDWFHSVVYTLQRRFNSVHDFRQQVQDGYPTDTPIPSEFDKLQHVPPHQNIHTGIRYTQCYVTSLEDGATNAVEKRIMRMPTTLLAFSTPA